MAIAETKKALERHLNSLTPSLPTAFEGVSFDPPATMYQRCQWRIDDPSDPVLGAGYHRENTQFQVFVVDVSNKGTGAAIARAELLREHFKKGSTFTEGGHRIMILSTPHITAPPPVGEKVLVAVFISVTTEVYEV